LSMVSRVLPNPVLSSWFVAFSLLTFQSSAMMLSLNVKSATCPIDKQATKLTCTCKGLHVMCDNIPEILDH
jgi:hypothetical protein